MYDRSIDVFNNLVFFSKQDSFLMDCTFLANQNIAFVCELNGEKWVEYKPFTGRVYEFDFTQLEPLYLEAQRLYNEQQENIQSQFENVIMPIQGLLAINEFGLSAQYEAWANSPDRTFEEKAYINYASVWRRDDPIIARASEALGITPEQLDLMFALAKTL